MGARGARAHRPLADRGPWIGGRRLVRAGIVVVSVVVVSAGLFSFSWRFRELVTGLFAGDFSRMAAPGGEAERLVISDEPRMVADYYRAEGSGQLVVLLHNSRPRARRAGLMRLLGRGLRDAGISVLAVDLPGFGESEARWVATGAPAFDSAAAIASRYAVERGLAGSGHIVYMGHSLGAGVALRAARLEPVPRRVIVLGAPAGSRRAARRGAEWLDGFARRRFEAMGLAPDDSAVAAMGRYLAGLDAVDEVRRGQLPPVCFVYGERERIDPELLAELRAVPDGPHELHVVPDASHHYNVLVLAGPLTVYDGGALAQLLAGARGCISGRA